ncbi:cupin domain-containing protein [Actinophytocola sp.]|uniref:cupin domain-containing protein n=1 Tax=Actinophytocola sp. TaxID=1872138 RepID=UPI002D80EE59|nr:cupin domain-containing protein [Actinophytocola sp.]HET9142515.1 cupin domain-containing protein [Actinophytocola sp.]
MTSTQPKLKVNVSEAFPNRRRGGDIRVCLSPKTVGCTSGFGGFVELQPGEFVSEHYHPYSEEFLYVIEGQLEMTVDGTVITLAPGDSLWIPIGAKHRLVNNTSAPARGVFQLAPLAPRPELGHVDTEPQPNPDSPHPEVGGAK